MADGGLGAGRPRLPPGWSASDESAPSGVRRCCRPGALGVTDGFQVSTPDPADAATSGLVHTSGSIHFVGRASRTDSRSRSGTGSAPPTRR